MNEDTQEIWKYGIAHIELSESMINDSVFLRCFSLVNVIIIVFL